MDASGIFEGHADVRTRHPVQFLDRLCLYLDLPCAEMFALAASNIVVSGVTYSAVDYSQYSSLLRKLTTFITELIIFSHLTT